MSSWFYLIFTFQLISIVINCQGKYFLGIFTTETKVNRRNLLRRAYMHIRPQNLISLFFVLGKPSNSTIRNGLLEENGTYGDLLLLDCHENMNEGKSFDYFRKVYENYALDPYKVVLKGDDDAIYHLFNLVSKLLSLNETSFYIGAQTWGHKMRSSSNRCYVNALGSLYGVSWDLVEYLALSNQTTVSGYEDIAMADFFYQSSIDYRVIDISSDFYHPKSCHPPPNLPTNMIVMHPLKDDRSTLHCSNLYFNGGQYPAVNATRFDEWVRRAEFYPYLPYHYSKGETNLTFCVIRSCTNKDNFILHKGVLHSIANDHIYFSPIFEANSVAVEVLKNEEIEKFPIRGRLNSVLALTLLLHREPVEVNETYLAGKLIVIEPLPHTAVATAVHVNLHHRNISYAIIDRFGQIYMFNRPIVSQNRLNNSCIATFSHTGVLHWSYTHFFKHRSRISDRKIDDYCMDGEIIRIEKSPRIYMLENRTRRMFMNQGAFLGRGYSFENVRVISDWEMDLIPIGSEVHK